MTYFQKETLNRASFFAILAVIVFLIGGCADSPTLTNPKPCAEYELISSYGDKAVFEKDITITVDVSDYKGELINGDLYTLCSEGSRETYISSHQE